MTVSNSIGSFVLGSAKMFILKNGKNLQRLHAYVDVVRESAHPEFFFETLKNLLENPLTKSRIIDIKPKSYGNFFARRGFSTIDLDREIIWTSSVLAVNKNILDQFVKKSSLYFSAIKSNNLEAALRILDEIEAITGKSAWAVENRIFCLQSFKGSKEQREYSASFGELGSNIIALIAGFASYKNEGSVTLVNILDNIQSQLENLESSSANYISFFNYHLGGTVEVNSINLSNLLRLENSMSLIDMYEAYIFSLNQIILSEDIFDESVYSSAYQSLNRLSSLPDIRIRRLKCAFETLQEGSSGKVRSKLINLIKDDENIFGENTGSLSKLNSIALTAKVKALMYGYIDETDDIGQDIYNTSIRQMYDIYSRNENCAVSYSKIAKLSLNARFIPDLRSLKYIADLSLYKDKESLYKNWMLRFLEGDISWKTSIIYHEIIDKYSIYLEKEELTHNIGVAIKDGLPIINSFEEKIIIEDPVNIPLISEFDKIHLTTILTEAKQINLELSIKKYNEHEAMRLLAEISSSAPAAASFLPIKNTLREKRLKEFKYMANSIFLPICFHLLYTYTDSPEALDPLRWSCDEFLQANSTKFPSQLDNSHTSFDSECLTYFLDNVCTPDVLEACRYINGPRAVDEERINICNRLIELNPKKSLQYREEIKKLTAKIVIEDGIKLIETNRVFVNARAIRSWADKDMRELFHQFQNILNGSDQINVHKMLKTLLSSMNGESELKNEDTPMFIMLDQEGDALLSRIMHEISKKYLRDPEHGLNVFISTRIRHGKIAGTLRGPLEKRQLVTTKAVANLPYSRNYHWMERLDHLDYASKNKLGDLLAQFSEDFDKIIEDELKPKLHIISDSYDKAYFGEPFNNVDVYYLKEDLLSDVSFSRFMDLCLTMLNDKLDIELTRFREYLSTEFKHGVEELFDWMLRELSIIISGESTAELRREIALAQTDFSDTIRATAEWFYLDDLSRTSRTYTLEQTLDIAVKSAQKSMMSFSSNLKYTSSGKADFGSQALSTIADVIYTCLDNIFKWSGIDEGVEGSIDLKISEDGKYLLIDVKNAVSQDISQIDLLKKTSSIRDMIETGAYLEHVPREGGSGLMKLKKIGATAGNHSLEFKLEGNQFSVNLSLPLSAMRI